MSDKVIRQDIVQVKVETDASPLEKLQTEINGTKSKLTGIGESKAFDHIKKEAKSFKNEATKVDKTVGSLKTNTGFESMGKDAKNAANDTDKVTDGVKKMQQPITESTKKSKKLGSSFKDVSKTKFTSVSSQLTKISTKLTAIAKKAAGAAAKGLRKLGGISFKATAAGLATTMVAVTALGGSAIATGKDFSAGMSNVQAISGATAEDMVKLRSKAKDLGASTVFTATESSEAMQYMAMAGWKTNDMLNGMEGVMNLAAAAGSDLATTSDIVTDGLTAFGLSAKDSNTFADVLAATATSANTNVEMMGETFKMVGATAGALGYSIQDVSLATGLMANAGIKSSQAGTSLRSFMSRLAKPTKESKTAMDKLGISITNSDGSMKSFKEIMQETRSAMSGLTKDQKASYAAMLAGKTGMSGLLSIVNSSEQDYNKLAKAIDNSSGAAKKMAGIKLDNLQGDITLLKSAWEGFQIELFDNSELPLRGAIKEVISWVNRLNKAFKKGGADGLIDEVGNVLGDAVGKIADSAPTFMNVIGGIFNKMVSALAKNAPQLAKGAASILTTLATSIRTNAGPIFNAAKSIALEFIKALIEAITGQPMGEDEFNSLKDTVNSVFGSFKKLIQGVISFGKTLATNLAPVLAFIGNLAVSAFGFIADHLDVILPIVLALVSAFYLYKGAMVAVNVITGIVTAAQSLMGAVCGTSSAAAAAGTTTVGTAASVSAPQVLAFAAAILAVGIAVLAICVGFALLAQSAIALYNAGAGAIAIMAVMVVVIAALVVALAFLGPVLTAGTVGFLAFGACVLMVGAGFALIGVGALLAAASLSIIAGVLPQLAASGAQGALGLIIFSAAMVVFSAAAVLTSIACLALGAGLLVLGVTLGIVAITAVVFAAAMLVIAVSAVVITSMLGAMMSALWQLPGLFLLMTPTCLLFAAALLPLTAMIIAVTIPFIAFTALVLALAVGFTILAVSSVVVLVAFAGITALLLAMNVLLSLFFVQLAMATVIFTVFAASALILAGALLPLTGVFLALTVPTLLFLATVTPLAVMFVVLAASSVIYLVAITGILAVMSALLFVTVAIGVSLLLLNTQLLLISAASLVIVAGLTILTAIFTAMAIPVMAFTLLMLPLTLAFLALAVATVTVTVSLAAALLIFTGLTLVVTVLVAATLLLNTQFLLCCMLVMTLTTTMLLFTAVLMILSPATLMFTAVLLPLTVTLALLTPLMGLFTVAATALMAIMLLLAPMSMLFSMALIALAPAMAILGMATPIFANALGPLAGLFMGLIIPAGLLAGALTPLSLAFGVCAVSSVALLAASAGLLGVTVVLSALLIVILMTVNMLNGVIPLTASNSLRLTASFMLLTAAIMRLVIPLAATALSIAAFAASLGLSVTAIIAVGVGVGALVTLVRLLTLGFEMFRGTALMIPITLLLIAAALKASSKQLQRYPSTLKAIGRSGLTALSAQLALLVVAFATKIAACLLILNSGKTSIITIFSSINLFNSGVNLMNGLELGILSKKASLLNTVNNIAKEVNKKFDKAEKINSPSKVWGQKGQFLGSGLTGGLKDSIPKVETAVQNISDVAVPYSGDYTPETDSYFNSIDTQSATTENNTYAPQFNLTINGGSDERSLGRKVKKWVGEALEETFEDLGEIHEVTLQEV